MNGTLLLENITLRLRLGREELEKLSARDVPVTLTWRGDLKKEISVDYAEVAAKLEEFTGKEYDYLEEVASDILGMLLREYPDGYWKVMVRKPYPPTSLRMESASFTVEGGENG